ncbi:MAG: 6-phosphogluconolactonase [Chloroflexota bacterium]|nr:6-phosphogluconolactonase [Chloroflexota bacterium]
MTPRTRTEVVVLPAKDDVARRGAEELVAAAGEAIGARGQFTVALSGGSTPVGMYKLLAAEPYRSQVAWEHVQFYWSDERCVPPDHPDSNYGAAARALLDGLSLPEEHVHRMRGEADPDAAAAEYDADVRAVVPGSPPAFDVIYLGMGDDGHTASLFPHTRALHVTDRLVSSNYVEKLDTHRLTFTSTLINAAKRVIMLVTGEGKAESLKAVLEGERDPETYPSQLVAPATGQLLWVVDEPAAKLLSRR